jgi:hypothetical protein
MLPSRLERGTAAGRGHAPLLQVPLWHMGGEKVH